MSNYMFRCENQFTSDLYPLRLKHINDQHGNVINPKTIIKTIYITENSWI
jgi:hypothetical protein